MNGLVIKTAVIIVILIAGVYMGNLGHSGNQATAPHYLSDGHWDDLQCGGCHGNAYDDVVASYHVQRAGDFEDSMYDGMSYLTRFEIEPGSEDDWAKLYMNYHPGGGPLETIDGSEGIDVDCNICHDPTGMYDWDARGRAIAEGRYTEANFDAVEAILTSQPVSYGVSTTRTCAYTCHSGDSKKTGVKWTQSDYDQYDAHASHSVECSECHITRDHQIGRGGVSDPANSSEAMKECIDCHEGISHGMVIDGAHYGVVACDGCHIPMLPAETVLESVNWANGVKEEIYKDSEIRPVLEWSDGMDNGKLPVPDSKDDPNVKLVPFNIITVTWWDAGINADVRLNPDTSTAIGNPIALADVKAADADNDGEVSSDEIHAYDGDNNGQPDYPNAVLRQQDLYFRVSHNIASTKVGLAAPLTCGDCHCASGTSTLDSIHFTAESIECTICHEYRPPVDWLALGYDADPASPGDYSVLSIEVEKYDPRPKPVEVEGNSALVGNSNDLTGEQ